MTPQFFSPGLLPKNSPAHKHFKEAQGKWGYGVVRCLVTKHTACRQGNCAVKKHVQCHSVCKRVGENYNGKIDEYVPGLTKDCGEVGKELCKGNYTDANGTTHHYGAIACRNVAMMA